MSAMQPAMDSCVVSQCQPMQALCSAQSPVLGLPICTPGKHLVSGIMFITDRRWQGMVHLLLLLSLACREYTRVTPKVKDIVFVATLKIMLKPLVEQIPGFGKHFARSIHQRLTTRMLN